MSTDFSASPGRFGVPKDSVVSLPGGRTITLAELQKMREGGALIEEDANRFLGEPEILIANPNKGVRFAWPLRTPRTQGLCRSGNYRKVTPEELKADTPYEVTTQAGVGGGQVEWHNHILVEMSDEFYQKHFAAPAWRGTEQLARLRERLSDKASQLGLTITPEVTATPVASF